MANVISIYGVAGWEINQEWVHSAGASLFVGGEHKTSISEERLERTKHFGDFPEKSIKYVLELNNLTYQDINIVVYVQNIHTANRIDSIRKILNNIFPNAFILFCDHHQAHILSAFYSSPFETACILSLDGAGNNYPYLSGYETGIYALGDKNSQKITVIKHAINSVNNNYRIFNLGQIYNNISRYIYEKIEPERARQITNPYLFMETAPGKIMGLAGYGNYEKVNLYTPLFMLKEDNFYFPIIEDNYFDLKWLDKYEPADIAAWLQHEFEEILIQFFKSLPAGLKDKNLCLAGGCALNVLANSRLLTEFKEVFVPPFPADSGLCLGGAIWGVLNSVDINDLSFPDNLALLGKEYTDEEILIALEKEKDKITFFKFESEQFYNKVATDLMQNKVIGWFNGKSEFGPRALGNRSILANPCWQDVKDYLNKEIKHREWWRPYAPVCIAEKANEYFCYEYVCYKKINSPYMTHSVVVNGEYRERLPGITHKDATARLQTVTRTENENLYNLLLEFEKLSGFPILLNTSFNIDGAPIVETPQDALKTFIDSRIDVLAINNFYITKNNNAGE